MACYFFKNMRLKKKLMLSYLFLVVLSSAIIGLVSYAVLKQSVLNEIGRATQIELQQTMQNIDYKLDSVEDFHYRVIINRQLKEMFENEKPSQKQKINYYNDFVNRIYPDIFWTKNKYVHNVYFFGENGVNLVSDGSYRAFTKNINEVKDTEIYKKADKLGGRTFWIPTHIDIFIHTEYGEKILSYVCKVFGEETNKPWGLLVINIRERLLYESYKKIIEQENNCIFITDSEGRIISHPEKDNLLEFAQPDVVKAIIDKPKGSYIEDIDGKQYSIDFFTSEKTGWKIISTTTMESIYNNVKIIKNTIIIVIMTVLILSIIISILISSGISKPVRRLVENMNRVKKGELGTRITTDSKDEIGQLGITFNEMTERIKLLLDNIKSDHEVMRKLEFKALQAQINPHFLYNTLDSIYWMTKTGEYREIAEMTTYLSSFFRLGLNNGEDFTTIEKEFKHAQNYLDIQKLRYNDKFTYNILLEDLIKECECVKLIIQPLVENTLLHGLRKKDVTNIEISGNKQGDLIVIEVKDDGLGFEAPLDGEVQAACESNDCSGYGLYNVNERIKIYFGKGYGLKVFSEKDKGTRAVIYIPFCKKGDEKSA